MVEVPTVRKYMKTARKTLKATDNMLEAMRVLIGNHFPAIPVIDDDRRIVGLLSEKDCLRTICRWANEQIAGGTVDRGACRRQRHRDGSTGQDASRLPAGSGRPA